MIYMGSNSVCLAFKYFDSSIEKIYLLFYFNCVYWHQDLFYKVALQTIIHIHNIYNCNAIKAYKIYKQFKKSNLQNTIMKNKHSSVLP
jgi:hypothetical protein